MILTDITDDSYEELGRLFVHEGPLAYVLGTPCAAGIECRTRWYRPAINCAPTGLKFDTAAVSLTPALKPLCTPDVFAAGLGENARKIWSEVLQPGLLALGGEFKSPSNMGFEVHFSANGNLVPLLLIGWPERDDKNVPREEKTFGSASMRVDVHVKRLYEASSRDVQITNKWMRRFYERGWRGRPSKGMRERWGVISVAAPELESKVQGIMRYLPSPGLSCHTGRPGDTDSLKGLLVDLSELLQELNGQPSPKQPELISHPT
jgi:hypothetical protein